MLAMSAWFRPIAVFQRSHIGGKLLFHIIASIITTATTDAMVMMMSAFRNSLSVISNQIFKCIFKCRFNGFLVGFIMFAHIQWLWVYYIVTR